MNNKIEYLQVRHKRAKLCDRRSFIYNIRLRLCAIQGERNMFYAYVSKQADEMEALNKKLMESEFYSS